MGWCSGSYLAEEIWDEIKIYIPEDKLQETAFMIYDKFSDMDADDWSSHPEKVWACGCPDEWMEYVKELAEGEGCTVEQQLTAMKDW